MIDVILNSKDIKALADFTYGEYDKNPLPLSPESLRWEYVDSPNVYTVDVNNEKRLYTISIRTFDGDLYTAAKYYETRTPNGFKYDFVENNNNIKEDACLSINGVFGLCTIFLTTFGFAGKINRNDVLESVVISRDGKRFKGEILRAKDRPNVAVYGPEGQNLKGRPTGENQPTFVRIK